MKVRQSLALSAAALLLAGCGGGGDDGLPEQTDPADLVALGDKLEEGWDVDCDDEPFEDFTGMGKIVCSLPEQHDPGDGTGMAVQSWDDRAAMEEWRDTFAVDSGFVAGDGWFVHAPTQEAADEAASVLSE